MKTLEHILQDVAKEHNCKDWTVLRNSLYGNRIKFDGIWMDVAHRFASEVAREALKNASENALLDWQYLPYEGESPFIDKQSILDEKNIPI